MLRLLSSVGCALLVVVATTFAAVAERRVALVIGNSQYKNASLTLANPKNDADDVATSLTALGFDVIRATDASKGDIEAALARFARTANESDSALFYYAGHAMQFQGRNYLMPVDAELEDEFSLRFNMVSVDDVRAALDRASGVRIMILDACRNNPLSERLTRNLAGGRTRAVVSTRGLARIDKTQGLVVAYATAAEDVAMDGPTGRNSPFTRALLRRMQEPGREITKMFQLVANDVRSETQGRQVPELSISLADDYYLNQNDRLIWERLREANDIPAIREFVDRFPYSIHVWAAKKRLDDLERWARERETQQRLQFEAAQRRDLEERLKKQQAEFDELRRQQAEIAADAERRREAEAARLRVEREREAAQQAEEAKRLAAIEAEKKRIAKEQADRQAEQQRADAARAAKEEAERRERELAARRQAEIQAAAAEAERLREEKRLKDVAEAERREQIAAREAEEAQKRKEERERLAKLEAERAQAKREAAQQAEEAKRLAAIEAEKKRIAKEQADRQAEQQRADAARAAKEEAERRARELAARRQAEIQAAAAEAERLREEKRLKDVAEAERRQQIAAREAEEAQKRKEERERLAKLEAERAQAKREADERERERKVAEDKRIKMERACERERTAYGLIEGNLASLQSFVSKLTCDEVRTTATERVAALNVLAQACKNEGDTLALLKGAGPDKREQLVQFEKQMSCEKLRPQALAVLAKLDAMPPAPPADAQTDPRDLVRNTQIALRRIGCFRGNETGEIDAATRTAVKRYREATDGDEDDLAITPNLLASINGEQPGTCPMSCPAGQVARGDTCVAESKTPPARAERPAPRRTAVREAPQRRQRAERPAPVAPVARAEAPRPGGGSSSRALGIGF